MDPSQGPAPATSVPRKDHRSTHRKFQAILVVGENKAPAAQHAVKISQWWT